AFMSRLMRRTIAILSVAPLRALCERALPKLETTAQCLPHAVKRLLNRPPPRRASTVSHRLA
ncbi:MAG TPA: hypothetical protein VLZ74_12165, partial [Methylocella sp.]|nr:hypothetical protein [Methylocella sp.]